MTDNRENQSPGPVSGNLHFDTTHWFIVVEAGHRSSADSEAALAGSVGLGQVEDSQAGS
jgi:hypothetical protein